MNKKTRSEIISTLVKAERGDLADILTVTSSPLSVLIANLNNDLVLEYGAIIQYVQHAALITDPSMTYLIDELKKHAKEELDHAILLSDRIHYLGGIPSIEVGNIKTSPDSVEMISQDLEDERTAIEKYTQRIKEAEALNDPETAEMLRGILDIEKEHEKDLTEALTKKNTNKKEEQEDKDIKGV